MMSARTDSMGKPYEYCPRCKQMTYGVVVDDYFCANCNFPRAVKPAKETAVDESVRVPRTLVEFAADELANYPETARACDELRACLAATPLPDAGRPEALTDAERDHLSGLIEIADAYPNSRRAALLSRLAAICDYHAQSDAGRK